MKGPPGGAEGRDALPVRGDGAGPRMALGRATMRLPRWEKSVFTTLVTEMQVSRQPSKIRKKNRRKTNPWVIVW